MNTEKKWALILGASSGFGEACARTLAKNGYDIFGLHLDRKAGLAHVAEIKAEIAQLGREAIFFNANAAAEKTREEVLSEIESKRGNAPVQVLIHSLAFGTLRPYFSQPSTDNSANAETIDALSMDMTLNVMAHSLVYWVQDLVKRKLMIRGGRVFAMTSVGSRVVWSSYGAVGAAKAALESHCRQIAVELAPHGITANAILAGVTDTPALRKIPGNAKMIEQTIARNPHGRLTTPQDVANAISLLCRPEAAWITGNTIFVDGAESIVG